MEKYLKIAVICLVILFAISLATSYYGSTDVNEYLAAAKFFSGKYSADIRSSHSLFYGFITSPLVLLSNSFFLLKLFNLFVLALIILSTYHLSGKNKKALILITASPIIWYLGPWISPIQISSLLFLWGFYFIDKFDSTQNAKYAFYSGLLLGLSAIFWNNVLYLAGIIAICFFFDKKLNSLLVFIFSFIIGLFPLFILEQYFFNFPIYSFSRVFISNFIALQGSIYPGMILNSHNPIDYILFLLIVPAFSYLLFSKKVFSSNKKQILSLTLIFLLFFLNPQPRYLLPIYPMLCIYLAKSLTAKQFKIQLGIFFAISLIITIPYIMQISYSTDSPHFNPFIENFGNWKITPNVEKMMQNDLNEIIRENSNETFIIGPTPDDYNGLALLYWGSQVKEFVSIQDYELFLKNESVLYKKRFESDARINDRRQIWLEGGISTNPNDTTDYDKITYAISIGPELGLINFELIRKYELLILWKKVNYTQGQGINK